MTTTITRPQRKRKRGVSLPVDPHAFESIGDIMRRIRTEAEAQMTTEFSPPLSTKLDYFLAVEQDLEEAKYD